MAEKCEENEFRRVDIVTTVWLFPIEERIDASF